MEGMNALRVYQKENHHNFQEERSFSTNEYISLLTLNVVYQETWAFLQDASHRD